MADIFMQLTLNNKENELLWFAGVELSDEIHAQASFAGTWQ